MSDQYGDAMEIVDGGERSRYQQGWDWQSARQIMQPNPLVPIPISGVKSSDTQSLRRLVSQDVNEMFLTLAWNASQTLVNLQYQLPPQAQLERVVGFRVKQLLFNSTYSQGGVTDPCVAIMSNQLSSQCRGSADIYNTSKMPIIGFGVMESAVARGDKMNPVRYFGSAINLTSFDISLIYLPSNTPVVLNATASCVLRILFYTLPGGF
jgi:hypothetical protein